ncbi:MAG TPA: nitrous oxide reductase family maturation protein NosD [Gemmatimonadaceae bacterium]
MVTIGLVIAQTAVIHTLLVGPGMPYVTPAAALDGAARGDTVLVAAGVYHGALTVHRPVVLIGEAGATIEGDTRTGTVLTVDADSVVVRGLTVRGSGRALDHDDAGVKLVRCTGCRVEALRIEQSLHGIYLLESDHAIVRDNIITGTSALPEAQRGNGIHLFHSTANRLEHNTITGTRDGIYFSFASDNDVAGNTVTGVRYGLHYMYSDDNRFVGNRFEHNAAGAAVMFSNHITFRENTFAHHVGYRAYGILLQTVEEVVAQGNRIEGNLVGVFVDGVVTSTFCGNVIAGNGIGIDLHESDGNRFAGNTIVDNRVPVRRARGTGDDAWAVNGRGNYWGDRAVFDLDGDGVGDRPYHAGDAFATLSAPRPVLELFSGTLAARALSWAEEALPVFDLSAVRVEDPAPLMHPPEDAPCAGNSASSRATIAASASSASPPSPREETHAHGDAAQAHSHHTTAQP